MKKPTDNLALLSAYLDGELSEEESGGISIRIMNDKQARARLGELKELNRLLAIWDSLDMRNIRASAVFEERLLKRMRCMILKSPRPGKTSSRLISF